MKLIKYILAVFSVTAMIISIKYNNYGVGIAGLILAWQMGWGYGIDSCLKK